MELVPEFLATQYLNWEMGPFQSILPGPLKIRMKLDGEIIVACELERGYLHRGLEKTFESRHWDTLMPIADRLDPEASVFAELALCLAVEEICDLKVPSRAERIRLILSELTRISSHLYYLIRVADSVNAETLMHYVLRDREKVLDLFELLSGSRFFPNFLRFGGVFADVSEGFVERVLELCDLIQMRIKEYNDLFSFNYAFLKRSTYNGVINPDQILTFGLTGPNARASGIAFDVRKAHPYCGYDQLDFQVCLGQGEFGTLGDCHDRLLCRLREVTQSIDLIRQSAENLPEGPFLNQDMRMDFVIPKGESYVRVESGRGLLGCYVVSEGGWSPSRVHFRCPSVENLQIAPELLIGARLGDLPLILASLDLSMAEVDR